jgi:regulator of replication initiation timing
LLESHERLKMENIELKDRLNRFAVPRNSRQSEQQFDEEESPGKEHDILTGDSGSANG